MRLRRYGSRTLPYQDEISGTVFLRVQRRRVFVFHICSTMTFKVKNVVSNHYIVARKE